MLNYGKLFTYMDVLVVSTVSLVKRGFKGEQLNTNQTGRWNRGFVGDYTKNRDIYVDIKDLKYIYLRMSHMKTQKKSKSHY